MKNPKIIKIEKATGVKFATSGKEENGVVWGTSYYLNLRGRKIRVSDHKNTSTKYARPDYNFLYSEVEQIIDVISYLQSLPKESFEVEVIRPLFNEISDIQTGVYNTERGQIVITKIENEAVICMFPDNSIKKIPIEFVIDWKGVTTEIRFID
jgi:hypothetical protein